MALQRRGDDLDLLLVKIRRNLQEQGYLATMALAQGLAPRLQRAQQGVRASSPCSERRFWVLGLEMLTVT